MNADVPPRPEASSRPTVPAIQIALILLLAATSAATATFATLYFTQRPAEPVPAQGQAGAGKVQADKNVLDDLGALKKLPITPLPTRDDVKARAAHKLTLAAFHDAVLAGQVPRAADLLKKVDVDEPDEEGCTALMKADERGNLRAALFLIAMGRTPTSATRKARRRSCSPSRRIRSASSMFSTAVQRSARR